MLPSKFLNFIELYPTFSLDQKRAEEIKKNFFQEKEKSNHGVEKVVWLEENYVLKYSRIKGSDCLACETNEEIQEKFLDLVPKVFYKSEDGRFAIFERVKLFKSTSEYNKVFPFLGSERCKKFLYNEKIYGDGGAHLNYILQDFYNLECCETGKGLGEEEQASFKFFKEDEKLQHFFSRMYELKEFAETQELEVEFDDIDFYNLGWRVDESGNSQMLMIDF